MASRKSLPVRECGLKRPRRQRSRGRTKSLPVRECGLKLTREAVEPDYAVTPRAGVWIETGTPSLPTARSRSLPVRECGLKHILELGEQLRRPVTPRAGVWIETKSCCSL